MRAFDAGTRGIALPKCLRCLISSSGLQCLKLLTRLQRDDTRLDLRPSAAASHRASGAVVSREAGLELHAALGIGARQPRDTLLALWAGHDLLIPVDVKVRLAEPFCGLRLPAGIFDNRDDHDNPVAFLSFDH